MKIYLDTICVDNGYPDPGHDEYVLIRTEKRSNKLLQRYLGDKKIKVLWYGEDKPNDARVQIDIERVRNQYTEVIRDNKIKELGL